jgi:hypothetical protein
MPVPARPFFASRTAAVLLPDWRYFEEVDNLFYGLTVRNFLFKCPSEVECTGYEAFLHKHVSGSHDVILSTETGVELDILKGSGNAELSQLIGTHAGNFLPIEVYLTPLGFVETIDAVEDGSLAGAIRSDDSQYLVIPDVYAHVGKSINTAKAQQEVVNPQFNLLISFHR